MIHDNYIKLISEYLINLAVPFTVVVVGYILIARALTKYEKEKEDRRITERIVNEIIDYSHNFLDFLTVFHHRQKFNPENVDLVGDKLTLNLSTLSSYAMLYFSKKKDVTTWNTYLDACNDHYSELMNRVVPPKPLSKTEMEVIREDLSDQFTSMMRVVRSAKYV